MLCRRRFLYLSALLALCPPFAPLRSMLWAGEAEKQRYPLTARVLVEAYWSETIAHRHYLAYSSKALKEKFDNIAYLFSAFAVSEKVHADAYLRLLETLLAPAGEEEVQVSVGSTKENLNRAARKELEKIEQFYPEVLTRLASESHDQAVVNCMYAWKSHRQHEKMIRQIKKYSGLFFSSLAKRIEGMNPNYHVCEICGSLVDEQPAAPCEICNFPLSHYYRLERPAPL